MLNFDRNRLRAALIGAAAIGISLMAPATATPVDFSASVSTGGNTQNAQGQAPIALSLGGNGSGSASASALLDVAGGLVQVKTTGDGHARAAVQYAIQIEGPGNGPIPVLVYAFGVANYTATAPFLFDTSSATLIVQDRCAPSISCNPNGVIRQFATASDYDNTGPQAFFLDYIPVNFTANALYDVSFSSETYGNAVAGVDPTFKVAPAFASLYHVVGVPAAITSTPEPGALVLLGLGALGLAARRRTR